MTGANPGFSNRRGGGGGGERKFENYRNINSNQHINTDMVVLEAPYRNLQAGTILERGQAHVTSLVRYHLSPFLR